MRGPHLAVVGQAQQLLMQGAEYLARALGLLDREVGAGDVADEQAVAGEHRPRLRAAGGVDQRERGVLRAVARGVQGADHQAAQLELPAVVEGLVLVVGARQAVDVDARARGGDQPAVPGDMVRVVVRLQDMLDGDAPVSRQLEVLVDLEAGIDHRCDPGALISHQVRGASEVVVGDLAEDHRAGVRPWERHFTSRPAAGRGAERRRRRLRRDLRRRPGRRPASRATARARRRWGGRA